MKRETPFQIHQRPQFAWPLGLTLFLFTALSACTVYESQGRKYLRQRATPQSKPTELVCSDRGTSPTLGPGARAVTITSPWPATSAWAESLSNEKIRIWIFSETLQPERYCTWTYSSAAEMNALLPEHLRASAEWLYSDL